MKIASPTVAAIDIGSNTIKALVAQRNEHGMLESLEQRTLDSRISEGISRDSMQLTAAAMAEGLAAVAELVAMVNMHEPSKIQIVATSAVREASNGAEFAGRIAETTGHLLQILSGEEEARVIGRGLLCDPGMRDWDDFHVFDLGGGSLEILTFEGRELVSAESLPLGCVRLAEKFVTDREAAFHPQEGEAIRAHVRRTLQLADIEFLPDSPRVAFTGGTITTSRAILAAAKDVGFSQTDARVTVELLGAILKKTGSVPLADRRIIPGLPARRADVMPTALATVIALAEVARITEFQHSLYNLRWGLVDSMLPQS
jgi:exopolyphosphatase / guanosine-5'-triphosphate,3'-diphosphate pyrophosphatase